MGVGKMGVGETGVGETGIPLIELGMKRSNLCSYIRYIVGEVHNIIQDFWGKILHARFI